MTRHVAPLLVVCALAATARADGFFYSEELGGTHVKDELAQYLPGAFRAKVTLGVRHGDWAIDGFFAADAPNTTDDAPAPVESLTTYGIDVKRIERVSKHVELYLRGTASYAHADGALDGYGGRGLGFGAGVQLKGKGSVLGLLCLPLFFTNIGPKMTGAIFLDDGYDFYRLHAGDDLHATPAIDAQLTHLTAGIAVGTDF
jgi:hypothetical protein